MSVLSVAAFFVAQVYSNTEQDEFYDDTAFDINEEVSTDGEASAVEGINSRVLTNGTSENISSTSDVIEEDDNDIFSGILDFVIHIFIPREDFWEHSFDRLDGRLNEKLPFQTYIDTIGRLKEVSDRLDGDPTALDITYDLNGNQYQLDIGRHLSQFIEYLRILITGVYIILIAYYNYRQIMFLIRGTNYIGFAGNGDAQR